MNVAPAMAGIMRFGLGESTGMAGTVPRRGLALRGAAG